MVNLTKADISDIPIGGTQTILDAVRKRWPWLKHLFADGTYDRTKLLDKAGALSWRSCAGRILAQASRCCRGGGSWNAPSDR
jgi:hypothetical protein